MYISTILFNLYINTFFLITPSFFIYQYSKQWINLSTVKYKILKSNNIRKQKCLFNERLDVYREIKG